MIHGLLSYLGSQNLLTETMTKPCIVKIEKRNIWKFVEGGPVEIIFLTNFAAKKYFGALIEG